MLSFNMTMDKTLLLDVGGTFIKTSDGREIPVDSNADITSIADAFSSAVDDFCRKASEDKGTGYGIGVAIPGPFDYSDGIFRMTHKYAAVNGMSFRSLAGVPDCVGLRFAHDVNCMLAGEVARGNGKGFSRVALVTLGTGLGFSMYIDGEILKKESGSPLVSIFSLPYKDGILEDYASKRGIVNFYASKKGETLSVKEIAEKAKSGDVAAREAFTAAGGIIAEVIAPILKDHGIECLLFGGQISRSFGLMEEAVRDGLSEVPSIVSVNVVSDFVNATFNGLETLMR